MLGVDLTANQMDAIAALGAYWGIEVDTDVDGTDESTGVDDEM